MRVLIGCECSGVVRRAFRALGHDAWSCDLLPAMDDSPHVRQEVYVSKTLIPLRKLKEMNFGAGDDSIPEEMHCNSGVCFL